MAYQLITLYGKNQEVTDILDKFEISIIPVLNADGFVYTHTKNRMWRKNRQPNPLFCVGTDPNRNWDYKFGSGGASNNPCSEAYQGPKPFSSQEALHMSNYISSQRGNIIAYIDFHSYSQLWMYPFGAECDRDAPDKKKLDRVAKAAVKALKAVHGKSFAAGPICEIIYQASGASVDWAYGKGNVTYSMAVELRDQGQYGFILPANQIIPSGEEIFAALKSFIQTIVEIENIKEN
jgi:murein tripeptide amidase MpaA